MKLKLVVGDVEADVLRDVLLETLVVSDDVVGVETLEIDVLKDVLLYTLVLTDVEDVVFEDTLELYELEDEYFELLGDTLDVRAGGFKVGGTLLEEPMMCRVPVEPVELEEKYIPVLLCEID